MAETRHSGRACLGRRKAVQLGPTERQPTWRHREKRHRPASSWSVGEKTAPRQKGGWMRRQEVREPRCGRHGETRGRGGPDWHDLLDRSNHHLDPAEVLLQRSKNGIWKARRKCRDWNSYRVVHEVSWGRLVAAGDFWAGDWSESAGRAGLNASWQADGQLGGWLVRSTSRAQASR